MDEILNKTEFIKTFESLGYAGDEIEKLYTSLKKNYIQTFIQKSLEMLDETASDTLIKKYDVQTADGTTSLITELDSLLKDNYYWKNKLAFTQMCQTTAYEKLFEEIGN